MFAFKLKSLTGVTLVLLRLVSADISDTSNFRPSSPCPSQFLGYNLWSNVYIQHRY